MSLSFRDATCVESLEPRRLLSAGDPDPSFGFGGSRALNTLFPGESFFVSDVALQADGKVLVAGSKGGNIAVIRLNVNGSVDTSFASSGLFESSARPDIRAIAVQPDGKIVLAVTERAPFIGDAVARLTANGSWDTAFGMSGITAEELTGIAAITLQQDGKIIAVGSDFEIRRWNSNGTADSTFDGDGYKNIDVADLDYATAVAIDYNGTPATNPLHGTIVIAGNNHFNLTQSTRLLLSRLRADGSYDTSFDNDGKMTSPNLSPQPGETATGVQIQPGGKIVVTGTALAIGGGNTVGDFLLARYLSNGALDTTFGPFATGVVQTDFGGDERALDLDMNLAGGLLIGGSRDNGSAVAAYTFDGQLDGRFASGGFLGDTYSVPVRIATSRDVIAPYRRILMAGGQVVGRRIDVAATVTLGAGTTDTNEATQSPLNVFVARPDRAPVPLRVYINIGGTAHTPLFGLPTTWDYQMAGINASAFTTPYVDIPAGEAFTTFSITPINDTRAEGDETIALGVSTDPTYDNGLPSSTTLVIRDDDVVGGPAVSSSQFIYDAGQPQRVTFTFTQNVGSSIGDEDFQITGPAGLPGHAFAYNGTTDTATLSFAALLVDGNYTVRALAADIRNPNGQPMDSDALLGFHWLNGDANHDRSVDTLDFNALAANFGGTNKKYSQADFNYDSIVDTLDFNTLAAQFGRTLPPAPSMQVAAATAGPVARPGSLELFSPAPRSDERLIGDLI